MVKEKRSLELMQSGTGFQAPTVEVTNGKPMDVVKLAGEGGRRYLSTSV